MEGRGFCANEKEFLEQSHTDLGSSKKWKESISLEGFFQTVVMKIHTFAAGQSPSFLIVMDLSIPAMRKLFS